MEVTPLTASQVDWNTFVDKIIKYTGKSPAKILDSAGVPPGDYASYLAILTTSEQPREGLRTCDNVLRFGTYSFLLQAPVSVAIALTTVGGLDMLMLDGENDVYIINGTLYAWKQAALMLCRRNTNAKVRYIINCCVLQLERSGLYDVFSNYRKEHLEDKTFALVQKEF